MASRARKAGSARRRNVMPGGPTTSPRERIRMVDSGLRIADLAINSQSAIRNFLAGVLHGPRLADHRHLDLAWIIELFLNGPGDVPADAYRVAVASLRGVGDDAHFPAGLDGIGVFDA